MQKKLSKMGGYIKRIITATAAFDTAGGSLSTLQKTTSLAMLPNINDVVVFNEVYNAYFRKDCPARSGFAVKDLSMGVTVEVAVVAHIAR